MHIANISIHTQRFTDKQGNCIEIAPGDSANVDISKDDIHVRAKTKANLIKVGGTEKQSLKNARELVPTASVIEDTSASEAPQDIN